MTPLSANCRVDIAGSISLVTQRPWVQNATLKQNIVFGNVFDEEKYQKVLDICCLRDDLRALTKGDQTEIGRVLNSINYSLN
jgi:ABC-type transport system involved in cytochrome bd biosynthesis fused ATPase/permease subunit